MIRAEKVGIIVRYWDSDHYLQRLVNALEDSFSEFEQEIILVVVQDGSRGISSIVLNAFNFEVVFVNQPQREEYCASLNRGAVEAMNRGAAYLLFSNVDVWGFTPNFVNLMIQELKDNNLDIVSPTVFDDVGVDLSSLRSKSVLGTPFSISTECWMLRSEVFKQLGYLDERLVRYYEDLDLVRKSLAFGHRHGISGKVCIVHAGSGLSRRQAFVPKYYLFRNFIWLKRESAGTLETIKHYPTFLKRNCTPYAGTIRPLRIIVTWLAIFGGTVVGLSSKRDSKTNLLGKFGRMSRRILLKIDWFFESRSKPWD